MAIQRRLKTVALGPISTSLSLIKIAAKERAIVASDRETNADVMGLNDKFSRSFWENQTARSVPFLKLLS